MLRVKIIISILRHHAHDGNENQPDNHDNQGQPDKQVPGRPGRMDRGRSNFGGHWLSGKSGPDHIQCATGFEPFDLLFIVRVVHRNSFSGSILVVQHNREGVAFCETG